MQFSIQKSLLYIFIFSITITHGQNISGIISYEGTVNRTYVDSFAKAFNQRKDVSMDMKQRITAYYNFNSAIADQFILRFKGEESNYNFIKPLETIEGDIIGSLASKNPYYINKKSLNIIEKSRSLGVISHKPLNWKITKETKKIGEYFCFKAVASERLYSRRGFYYNRQVIAWFTPEISVNFGPSKYVGLPGLVLEVQRDKFTLRAKSIILNPEEEIKINPPKGNTRIISEDESHKRIAELTKSLRKN